MTMPCILPGLEKSIIFRTRLFMQVHRVRRLRSILRVFALPARLNA